MHSFSGYRDIVKIFLDAACDVSATRDDGNTPLHSAAENGHASVVRMLLAANAASDVTNKDNKTAFELAVENEHDDVIALLSVTKSDDKANRKRNVEKSGQEKLKEQKLVNGHDIPENIGVVEERSESVSNDSGENLKIQESNEDIAKRLSQVQEERHEAMKKKNEPISADAPVKLVEELCSEVEQQMSDRELINATINHNPLSLHITVPRSCLHTQPRVKSAPTTRHRPKTTKPTSQQDPSRFRSTSMMSFAPKKQTTPAARPATRDDLVKFKAYLNLAMNKTRTTPAARVTRVENKNKAVLNEKIHEFVKSLEDFKRALANGKADETTDP